MDTEDFGIVYFDGVCGLCNKSVDFLVCKDKRRRLRYCSLQSEKAAHVRPPDTDDLSTMVLEYKGKLYYKSTGAIRTLALLGGGWKLMKALLIFPAFLRNGVYNIIARNRYKWWGKKESCRLPEPDEAHLFLG